MSANIAFLGLGAMGFGMATNLLKSGFSVTGFDIWPPTLERFAAAGGKTASSPREVVKGSQYVVFMVATAGEILHALFNKDNGAVFELPLNAVVILCSTGPPDHVPKVRAVLDGRFKRPDVQLVDAPVSGGTIRAAAGTLTVLASGLESAVAAAKPVLDALAGRNLYVIPGGLGAGTKVKMVHQVLAGIHITLASEVMGFAAALGLNTRFAFEGLKDGEGGSWMFENRVPHMLEEDRTVYSALNIIVKDVGIVTAAGRAEKFPLFLSSATEQVLATGVSADLGLEDDSHLTKVYLPKDTGLLLKQVTSATATTVDDKMPKLLKSILAAVHLAAAIEGMSLGAKVGLDLQQLYEIISGAAGASWIFKNRIPQLLSGKWTSVKIVDNVIAELTEAMEEANKMKYPLHLTGTTLQLFQAAALQGLGKEPDVAISKLWSGPNGPWLTGRP